MKKTYYPLLLLFFCVSVFSQKAYEWDTLKYQKFHSNLIVSLFQSYRNFKNDFQQFKVPDSLGRSKNLYHADSRLVTGIEIIYDKFSFGIGLKTKAQDNSAGKGKSANLNANLNFGGNIWYFQNTFRYFKGFYDDNTVAHDTTIRQTGQYYQRPDMENLLFRSKFLYFTNHDKYAFRAGFAGNYRQLKSAGTWIMSANMNYYKLRSDSSFFAMASRPYYGDYASMQALRVFGVSFNAGAAATLVIMKGFFINGMFIIGPEQQWRKYSYSDENSALSYISVSGDLRFSIGFNLKYCYFMLFNTNDFAVYNSSYVGLTNSSITGGFSFGLRFDSGMPEFYKKFQKTKFYTSI
jgi:hypothetical protein